MSYQPVVLIIRDGWGENHNNAHTEFNAVTLANTPVADDIREKYPRTEIKASGLAVGLPDGVMGNSEVGHQNIGAGRIVDQELVRINKGFAEKTVLEREVFQQALTQAKSGHAMHIFGLISDAGVHAMLEHIYSMLALAKEQGVTQLYLHAFTDGRDTPPHSGLAYIQELEAKCAEIGLGQVASITGRYWAMDRDLRWDRIEKAYNCITARDITHTGTSAQQVIQDYYDHPVEGLVGDEFIPATAIVDDSGQAVGAVQEGDVVLFVNYRGDRPRELTRAFIEDDFDGFDRGAKKDVFFITMTEYQKDLCPHVLFHKPEKMEDILGMYVSNLGIPQFRCAETEKFPHVTFFFNDYREEPFPLEDRVIIPSPQDCATYDEKPAMSAAGVFTATQEAILSRKYGLIVVNFANPDMVGHTGSLPAAIEACQVVDAYVGELLQAIASVGGHAVVTADHGNCDQMFDPEVTGPHTSHTLNPVEIVVVSPDYADAPLAASGQLGDIAPTLLELMNLPQPDAMTGTSLLA